MQNQPDNLIGVPSRVSQSQDRRMRELQAELMARQVEALNLYEPHPKQAEFHDCLAMDRLITGGNRCLAGDQEIYDPIRGIKQRVRDINGSFHVEAWTGARVVAAYALAPFVKCHDSLVELSLSNGEKLRVSPNHLVLCVDGIYRSVAEVCGWPVEVAAFHHQSTADICQPESLQGEHHCSQTRQDSRVGQFQSGLALLDPKNNDGRIYITSVRYLEQGPVYDFTVPRFGNYLAGGIVNHNSGKSISAYVEDARACLGRDPKSKYPSEGVLIVIGYGWEHCGKVVYRLLFQKGAFQIIKDKATGKWRAFHPSDPEDAARKSEAKPAPPLIPERYLKGGRKGAFAWNDRKKRQFTSVELTTGWTIYYFASEGDPEQAQGFPADLVHIDENIHDRRWIGEMFSRLSDRNGRFVWSTIPGEDRTGALNELIDDADKQVRLSQPRIVRFEMPFFDNPFIGREEKQLQMARWSVLGEDELRRRAYGQAGQGYLMYPNFSRAVHGFDRSALPGGIVPSHWTRYVVVDPGHTVTAVLFAAVPPPAEGRLVLLYDELYLSQCSAPMFGDQMAQHCMGQQFEAFIIDDHGGNLADLSTGTTWRQTFARELKRHNIRCRRTGCEFIPGSDDIEARTNAVRLALYSGDGSPRLRFLLGAVPNFERTMQRYHKKRDKLTKQITDRPDDRGDCHMAQVCEYLFAFDPQYHRPPDRKREPSATVKAFRTERARERRSESLVSFV